MVLISCAVSAKRTCPRCSWSNCEYPGSPANVSGNSEKLSRTVKMLAVVRQRFCRLCSLVALLREILWIKFFVASVFLITPWEIFPQAFLKEKSQYPFFFFFLTLYQRNCLVVTSLKRALGGLQTDPVGLTHTKQRFYNWARSAPVGSSWSDFCSEMLWGNVFHCFTGLQSPFSMACRIL